MIKVLVKYESDTWSVIKTGFDRREMEDWAILNLPNKEYMVVSVLRHHSGEPEEFQFKNKRVEIAQITKNIS